MFRLKNGPRIGVLEPKIGQNDKKQDYFKPNLEFSRTKNQSILTSHRGSAQTQKIYLSKVDGIIQKSTKISLSRPLWPSRIKKSDFQSKFRPISD